MRIPLTLLFVILLFTTPQISKAKEWYASSRHGECLLLERVFHNEPYVSGATTPAEVAEKLDKAGVKYSLQPIKEGEGGMFRLDVPSTEWSMLLVKKKFCHEFMEL